jgi:hypothetical protein
MVKQRSLALDEETLAAVDGYARQLERQLPGLRVSRSSAARTLIKRGLNQPDGDGEGYAP